MDKDTTLLILAAVGLFLYMNSQKQAAPQVIYQPTTPTEGGGNTTGEIIGLVGNLVKIGSDIYNDYRSAQATDYDNATLAYT